MWEFLLHGVFVFRPAPAGANAPGVLRWKTTKGLEYMTFRVKQVVVLTVFLMFGALILSGCTSKPPSENQLEETFTEEFLSQIKKYYINGIEETFSIWGLSINHRQTEGHTDISYCTIGLENSEYNCSVEAALTYEYYDKGGWILEDWEILSTKIQPLNGVPDNIIAADEAKIKSFYPDATLSTESSYTRRTNLGYDTSTDILWYDIPYATKSVGDTGMEIIEGITYIEYGGTIKITYTFVNTEDGYRWEPEWDYSSNYVSASHWKGRWYREEALSPVTRYVWSLDFNELSLAGIDGTISMTLNYAMFYDMEKSVDLTIPLTKCTAGTLLSDIFTLNDVFSPTSKERAYKFDEIECFYYGEGHCTFSYLSDSYDDYCFIAFTSEGIFFAERGKPATGDNGYQYIQYQGISTYTCT